MTCTKIYIFLVNNHSLFFQHGNDKLQFTYTRYMYTQGDSKSHSPVHKAFLRVCQRILVEFEKAMSELKNKAEFEVYIYASWRKNP
jgi:hypothetical protein